MKPIGSYPSLILRKNTVESLLYASETQVMKAYCTHSMLYILYRHIMNVTQVQDTVRICVHCMYCMYSCVRIGTAATHV